MAIADITKPIALDETLQSTNGLLGTQNGKLDSIVTAIMSISLASVGNVNSLTTTDKTSLVGAVNELNAGKVSTSEVGVAGGVAELDNTGKVPASQLPAFVDDVIEGYLYNGNFYEDSAHTQLITPEDGKIYIDLVSNKTYRWSGSQYTVISDTLALGETSTTAYRGDRGKTAYDHSQDANRITTAKAEGLYKIGATAQGHISSATAVTKGDITALGLVGSVTDSTTNGNIVVDGSEIQVYDDTDVTNDITDINGKLTTATTTATGNPINFSTLSAQNAESTIIDLEPIQDLHGYDKPWVGGAGKNKLPMTVALIKALNTDGTWTGNSYVVNNVTFTIIMDSDNNVTGIKVNGTANARTLFVTAPYFTDFLTNGVSYTINGNASGYSADTAFLQIVKAPASGQYNVDDSYTFTYDSATQSDFKLCIRVDSGKQASNLIFYPMIRLSTVSDATFEPYENICPISGRTEIGILGCGKNLFDKSGKDTTKGYVQNAYLNSNGSTNAVTGFWISEYIKIPSNTSISLSGLPVSNSASVCFYDSEKNYISGTAYARQESLTITAPINSIYVRISTHTDNESTTQFKVGSSTAYSPYTKSTDLTIQFGETVYGGTLDVENGVLVVDKGYAEFDGSNDENWILEDTNRRVYTGKLNGIAKLPTEQPTNAISNRFQAKTSTDIYNRVIGFAIGSKTSTTVVYVNNTGADMVLADWLTWLSNNPLQVCYELANPITIQLTPHQISLLKGVNNISVSDDYSEITLTYRSGEVATLGDVKEAIDNLPTGGDYHEYSTEEKVVAKWIDGNPVYEKTIVLENAIECHSGLWTSIGITASSLSISSYISCVGYTADGTCWNGMFIATINSNIAIMIIRPNETCWVKTLVIQYTKST